MNDTPADAARSTFPRSRPIIVVLLVLAIAAGLWAAWTSWPEGGRRLEVVTPYRNAQPGVQYVGDAACARCHAEIATAYSQHPMGRSLFPIDSDAAPGKAGGEEGSQELFETQGLGYSVERRGGRTFHRETRRDGQGRVIAQIEGEVRYVLGSGSRALAFLIDHDGYLFESPITWYAQRRRWDLSPGFEDKPDRFERQITPECLFCHANHVELVPGTMNRYRPPLFQGHAIGCERCHGPGELHVRQPLASPDAGPNIVNPRNLEPALRESVCQQCHLAGEKNIEKFSRTRADYRPGLPLHRFETVFVRPPGPAGEHQNASQVEQMYQSRCYRASRGALGCISCHDPHRRPAPEEKAAFFRQRCLACHSDTDRGCTLAPASRRAQRPDESCIACHMPMATTTNIPHVATTVHSIPRHPLPDGGGASPPADKPSLYDDTALIPFHRNLMSPEDLREARRDLGVALCLKKEAGAAAAMPLLKEALAAHPDDLVARESEGLALGALGHGAEGLTAFESVLSQAPGREMSLWGAAILAAKLGRRPESIAFWQRIIAIDPWCSDYHAALANQLARSGRWPEAAAACRRALRLNPAQIQARVDLIQSTLHVGSAEEAHAELETLLEFDPDHRDDLLRWFNTLH